MALTAEQLARINDILWDDDLRQDRTARSTIEALLELDGINRGNLLGLEGLLSEAGRGDLADEFHTVLNQANARSQGWQEELLGAEIDPRELRNRLAEAIDSGNVSPVLQALGFDNIDEALQDPRLHQAINRMAASEFTIPGAPGTYDEDAHRARIEGVENQIIGRLIEIGGETAPSPASLLQPSVPDQDMSAFPRLDLSDEQLDTIRELVEHLDPNKTPLEIITEIREAAGRSNRNEGQIYVTLLEAFPDHPEVAGRFNTLHEQAEVEREAGRGEFQDIAELSMAIERAVRAETGQSVVLQSWLENNGLDSVAAAMGDPRFQEAYLMARETLPIPCSPEQRTEHYERYDTWITEQAGGASIPPALLSDGPIGAHMELNGNFDFTATAPDAEDIPLTGNFAFHHIANNPELGALVQGCGASLNDSGVCGVQEVTAERETTSHQSQQLASLPDARDPNREALGSSIA